MPAKHYHFRLLEDDGDGLVSYVFETANSAIYTVYFNVSEYESYLNQYPNLFNKGVAFGFFCISNPVRSGTDLLIGPTIESILHDFIKNNGKETVLLFHCDYSDARQACRDKLFTIWYNKSDLKSEFKWDRFEATISETNITHFMGYITPNSNPNLNNVQLEFDACAFNLMQEKIQ